MVTLRRFVLLGWIRCYRRRRDRCATRRLTWLLRWYFCSIRLCWRSSRLFIRNDRLLFLIYRSIFHCRGRTFSWLLSGFRAGGCLWRKCLLFGLNLWCRGRGPKLSCILLVMLFGRPIVFCRGILRGFILSFLCRGLDIFRKNLRLSRQI